MYTTEFLDIPPLAGAHGTVTLPGSKSISNRVLLLAALSRGRTVIHDLLDSDDTRVMLAALDFGCVYHWYNDLTVRPTHPHLVQYMYPITPVELHAGYIIGKERIITKTSGMFGWNDASTHEVHVFDDTGREVEGFDAPQLREDGVTWTELRIAEDWSAVIVKK